MLSMDEHTSAHCPLTSGLQAGRRQTSPNSIVSQIKPEEHHKQCELCTTRARYRQGKEFKAVKVYTVNQESCHLILQNIPAVGLGNELKKLCRTFGKVESFDLVANYPAFEEFTETFYVKYTSLKEARFAKKKLDNRSFYGGLIHIFYAPELESVEECREKLKARKDYVNRYVDPYTLAQSRKAEGATKANVSDEQTEIVGTASHGNLQEPRVFTRPYATGSASSTSICANKRAECKQILLSSTSAAREKAEKAKELQVSRWKLEKGKEMRAESRWSSSSVCESEKAEMLPQEWARTGQETTFANQSAISAPSTKTAKELFGKHRRIQEAFPNSTAGTSYSAISSTCDEDAGTMEASSRTDTLSAATTTAASATAAAAATSFFDRTSKDQVLFKPRQTYNYVLPKPLSATRIVFHRKTEKDSPEDDSTSTAPNNKRRKEEDEKK